jgi:hypothetical protein
MLPFSRLGSKRQRYQHETRNNPMEFAPISFDQIAVAAMACIAVREAMIMLLPDDIAGPGGWLVNTGDQEEA